MKNTFDFSQADLQRLFELGGVALSSDKEDIAELSPNDDLVDADPIEYNPDIEILLHELAEAALSYDPDLFSQFVEENRPQIMEAASCDDRVGELLLLGFRYGISQGSGACMNDLGALYYMGDIVDQNYEKARQFYEMAIDHGCLQSIINLGYIYEYGRTGEPDCTRAYECYALAAALAPSYEAVYKLGDMYSRGQSIKRDMRRAFALWQRSFELADGTVQVAQPAIRMAQTLIDSECEKWNLELDPFSALSLFQQAEIGLRIDIANGQTYYTKRLTQAIEGQKKARAMLDESNLD